MKKLFCVLSIVGMLAFTACPSDEPEENDTCSKAKAVLVSAEGLVTLFCGAEKRSVINCENAKKAVAVAKVAVDLACSL